MRRITRGAAAVAALCAGALTVSSLAVAMPGDALHEGSGVDANSYRVAGRDRIQTSLEALEDFDDASNPQDINLMIVGINGVVDALSLAPLAGSLSEPSVVLYAGATGLDKRTVEALGSLTGANVKKIIISGGFKAVPATVEAQLTKAGFGMADIYRIAGANRFETAYLTGAYAKNWNLISKAGWDLAQAQYKKEQLAIAKAAYEAAKAKDAAAVQARDAAYEAYVAAAKTFGNELKKLGDTDVAAANATLDSALAGKDYEIVKEIEALKPYMEIVREATRVSPQTNPVKYADVEKTLADVYKAGDDKVKEAVDKLVAGLKNPVTGATINLSFTVAEATTALDNAITDGNKALVKRSSNIAAAIVKVSEVEAAKAALKDKNSAVFKAAVAYNAADKALSKAQSDVTAAYVDFVAKRAAYKALWLQSFADFGIEKLKTDFDEGVAKTYKDGNFNIFLSTGMNFADALTAGPAAAKQNGVVLLTNGASTPAYVLDAAKASNKTVYAIGGPAAKTFIHSVPVVGANRYDTSAKVAAKFFGKMDGGVYALASGETGADAVIAGVYNVSANKMLARAVTTSAKDHKTFRAVLLVRKNSLPNEVRDYISYGTHAKDQKPVNGFAVFGGEMVIKDAVVSAAISAAKK